ncbi:hypothetical protein DIPPA_21104 [Diplonema papillatum]|nr:hypothetical protein DIPPA_21104 [Diplonema papillatum]|eukprot:gene20556-31658_t
MEPGFSSDLMRERSCRGTACRVTAVVSGVAAVVALCFLSFQSWRHLEAESDYNGDVAGRDEETTCEVVRVGSVTRSEVTGGFRSSVVVAYAVRAKPVESTAWSMRGSDEYGPQEEAAEFLRDFGVPGMIHTCWYDPSNPSLVRLWDEQDGYLTSVYTLAAAGYFALWLCCAFAFVVYERCTTSAMLRATSNKEFTLQHLCQAGGQAATFTNLRTRNALQPAGADEEIPVLGDSDSDGQPEPARHDQSRRSSKYSTHSGRGHLVRAVEGEGGPADNMASPPHVHSPPKRNNSQYVLMSQVDPNDVEV